MRVFLAVAAILAWIFATALLLAPGKFYSPTGITLTPMLATLPCRLIFDDRHRGAIIESTPVASVWDCYLAVADQPTLASHAREQKPAMIAPNPVTKGEKKKASCDFNVS